MPLVTVRYWAGARRAAGRSQEQIDVPTVGALRSALADRRELAAVCAVASVLVDGERADDLTTLRDGAEVDILPPFAGG